MLLPCLPVQSVMTRPVVLTNLGVPRCVLVAQLVMHLLMLRPQFPGRNPMRRFVAQLAVQVLMRVPQIRVQVTMLRSEVLMQHLMLPIAAVIAVTAAAIVAVAAAVITVAA